MIVVVEVEGYCGLCCDMLRITVRFHLVDILISFASYRFYLTGNQSLGNLA